MLKRLMKMGMTGVMILALATGCTSGASNTSEGEGAGSAPVESTEEVTIEIGITQIVEHPALDSARDGFVEAMAEAGYTEGQNVKYILENAQGDMPTAQVIAQSFVDEDVDMIYAIATPTAQAALNATKDIPIMISAVTDPVAAGLVESNEKPNTNVSGTSDEAPIDLQLDLFDELGIEMDTIGFIYNTSEKNSEVQLEILKAEAAKREIEVEVLGITSLTELEQGIDVLLEKVDVLYTPADNMIASGIHLVTNKANEKGVAVLGAESAHVDAGALATCGVDYFALGRQTGVMAAKVLNGESISDMPVQKALSPEITINKATADLLGMTLSEDMIQKSILVGEK